MIEVLWTPFPPDRIEENTGNNSFNFLRPSEYEDGKNTSDIFPIYACDQLHGISDADVISYLCKFCVFCHL